MTDDHNVLIADAQERIASLRSFLGSEPWERVEASAQARIAQAFLDFERGNGVDAELRGEIRACRHILSLPHQMVASEERIINNNRGKT